MSVLIAYYSRADENYLNGNLRFLDVGNTEVVARKILARTGGTLFKIEPVVPYARDYDTCIEEARADLKRNARPAIEAFPITLEPFDVVYLGYPNYWGTMPMAVFTFLEHFDFTGKTIRPFCTHEGSGLGHSERDIAKLCPGAKIGRGLAIHGTVAASSGAKVAQWVEAPFDE